MSLLHIVLNGYVYLPVETNVNLDTSVAEQNTDSTDDPYQVGHGAKPIGAPPLGSLKSVILDGVTYIPLEPAGYIHCTGD